MLVSLFFLGGEVWDKVHALFVHDASGAGLSVRQEERLRSLAAGSLHQGQNVAAIIPTKI